MTANMITCDFPPGVIITRGAIKQLGTEIRKFSDGPVLLVSDGGVESAGIVATAEAVLRENGLEFATWLGVEENPTSETVARGVRFAETLKPELIVGLGGGSSMDCAKGINFILTNGGTMKDYWGIGKASKALLPMIAVPTTAGTGSETQSFALISDPDTHVKMACGDEKAAFRTALLDPELTLTQPRSVVVATGIDAISHAIESAVTTKRTPTSDRYARQAWILLAHYFKTVLDNPENMEAREAMQTGAMFAGAAIENSMLGAAHALANPLTARYGITHGPAVALMLPHVIRFNGPEVDDIYQTLIESAKISNTNEQCPAELLADYITSLLTASELPQNLADYNIPETDIPALAKDAATQWTAQFNPRRITPEDMFRLYTEAHHD